MPGESRRLARLLAELAVIAVGVFVGLAADAAWEDRQERVREQVYLREIRSELLLAQEEIRVDNGRWRGWLAATDSLLAHFDSRSAADSVLNVWVQQATMYVARFNPPTSVMDELIASGNLSLLRSDQVRFGLLAYGQASERLRFLENYLLTVREDGLRPYLTERFAWVTEVVSDEHPAPLPIEVSAWSDMLADPEFRNLLAVNRQRLRLVLNRSEELEEYIGALIQMTGSELRPGAY